MGNITEVPTGHSVEFLLSISREGVREGVMGWGDLLRTRYGKDRAMGKADLTTTHLGYSTDNGAYYYYYTESGSIRGKDNGLAHGVASGDVAKTYQDTLVDVAKYAASEGLPYRHWLMDSWWYPKDEHGGVITWTAMGDIFPDGIDFVFNHTSSWSIVAHNRYWSPETPYAKANGGDFDFIIDAAGNAGRGMSMPVDAGFWDWLLVSHSPALFFTTLYLSSKSCTQ